MEGVTTGLATEADIAGILRLQAENHISRGGSLSANMSGDWVAALINAMPLIVARRGERIVGFLMTAPREKALSIPILAEMLKAYWGRPDAYVYGPVCVEHAARGQGIAPAMFDTLRAQLLGREGILFIRRDNTASLRTHAKMGMEEVATFMFNGVEHAVLRYIG